MGYGREKGAGDKVGGGGDALSADGVGCPRALGDIVTGRQNCELCRRQHTIYLLTSLVLHLRPRSAHDQRCFAFPLRLYLRLSLGLRTPFPFIFSAGQSF